jgi:hypothetical protein
MLSRRLFGKVVAVAGGNVARRPDQYERPAAVGQGLGAGFRSSDIGRFRQVFVGGPSGGVFIYSGAPALGNLIGSWAGQAGVDPYGNAYPQGLSDTIGVLFGSVIAGGSLSLNPGPLLLYGNTATVIVYLTGAGNWAAPANLAGGVVFAECWAGGGGGGANLNGSSSAGGGSGGEYAAEPALAVTAGNNYAYSQGAAGSSAGSGGNTTFAGDAVTVTAHGGHPGGANGGGSGSGTGSTNTVHFKGGAGAVGGAGVGPGGGGGGSGGPLSAGNAGSFGGGGTGKGAAAVSGGGPGGNGGSTNGSAPVSGPGGGGGGGGQGKGAGSGGAGFAGQIRLTYTVTGGTAGALLASLATAAGTDPATGTNYPAGLELAAGIPADLDGGLDVAGGLVTDTFASNAVSFTSTPADPAATVSTTQVMMGLGSVWQLTPASSGKVLVVVEGLATTATAVADLAYSGRFGTPASGAPANGAAVVGTIFGTRAGVTSTIRPALVSIGVPFTLTAVLSLVKGTSYWFDIALNTGNAADAASVTNMSISLVEVQ